MSANLRFSTKSIFLIAAILFIPTTVILAVTNDIDCAGTDGFCEGTDGNDSMLGTSDTELIKGKNGFDLVFGLGNEGGVSPEELMGGDGGDEIVGDDDVLGLCVGPCDVGSGGNDNIDGENGDDFVIGDIGDDRISGGNENDILFGGDGNDDISGGNGDDQLFGGNGEDIMFGENGNDFLFGGEGNDDISGGDGIDFIDCGRGENDIARINPSEDTAVNCEVILEDITGPIISTSEEPSGDPVSALSDISDDIQILIDANVGTPIEDKLNSAQSMIDDAIGKIGSDNQDAVSKIEGAEGDVEAAENEGLDPDDGKIVMDDLAGVARQIARDEIDQGIAGACDGSLIDDAIEALSEGDSLRASESYKDAVSKYKDAVSKAQGC